MLPGTFGRPAVSRVWFIGKRFQEVRYFDGQDQSCLSESL
jgi:hypothetical protein